MAHDSDCIIPLSTCCTTVPMVAQAAPMQARSSSNTAVAICIGYPICIIYLNTICALYKIKYILIAVAFRPAFVNILFPVARLHHVYSTTLVIIIVIDNLKYVIISLYTVCFLSWKIPEVSENVSQCPSK